MSSKTAQIKQLREATYASFLDCANALKAHNGDFEGALEALRARNLNKAAKKASREAVEGLIVSKQTADSACIIEMNCETDFVALTGEFKAIAHRIAEQILGDPALTDLERVLAADFIDTPGQSIALTVKELAGKLGENIKISRVARYARTASGVLEAYVHAGAISGYGPQEGRLGILLEVTAEANSAAVDTAALQTLAHDLALQIASNGPVYVARTDIPAEILAEKRAELAAELVNENKPEDIKARIIEGRLNKFYRQNCLLEQAYIKDEDITVEALLRQNSTALGMPVQIARFIRFKLDV